MTVNRFQIPLVLALCLPLVNCSADGTEQQSSDDHADDTVVNPDAGVIEPDCEVIADTQEEYAAPTEKAGVYRTGTSIRFKGSSQSACVASCESWIEENFSGLEMYVLTDGDEHFCLAYTDEEILSADGSCEPATDRIHETDMYDISKGGFLTQNPPPFDRAFGFENNLQWFSGDGKACSFQCAQLQKEMWADADKWDTEKAVPACAQSDFFFSEREIDGVMAWGCQASRYIFEDNADCSAEEE